MKYTLFQTMVTVCFCGLWLSACTIDTHLSANGLICVNSGILLPLANMMLTVFIGLKAQHYQRQTATGIAIWTASLLLVYAFA
ncbi:hypothetical protein AB8Q18_09075 [Neisseriaceae bacterium CLB008]|nr:hypothetical protein [Neisseriaceae bacterium]